MLTHKNDVWAENGPEIVVLWPVDDPNTEYRCWLEEYVGTQGVDWDWAADGGNVRGWDSIIIKFKEEHADFATIAALKWS